MSSTILTMRTGLGHADFDHIRLGEESTSESGGWKFRSAAATLALVLRRLQRRRDHG